MQPIMGRETWESWRARKNYADFNLQAHDSEHLKPPTPEPLPGEVQTLTYISGRWFGTGSTGRKLFFPGTGSLLRVRAHVNGAVATTKMTWDILKDVGATSIFNVKPTIAVGDLWSLPTTDFVTGAERFNGASYFTLDVVSVGTFSGPITVYFKYALDQL